MDIIIAIAMLAVGVLAGTFLVKRGWERAEYEDAVAARLARYAGRRR